MERLDLERWLANNLAKGPGFRTRNKRFKKTGSPPVLMESEEQELDNLSLRLS